MGLKIVHVAPLGGKKTEVKEKQEKPYHLELTKRNPGDGPSSTCKVWSEKQKENKKSRGSWKQSHG